MPVDYRGYIKQGNRTIEGTAGDIGKSDRQFKRYLDDETKFTDELVLRMTHVLGNNAAALPFEHFTNQSEIGQRLYPEPLNNIDREFASFCFKAPEEMEEMADALQAMCRIVLNGRLMTVDEARMFDKMFREILDVEQLCLEIKIKYAKLRGIEELEARVREHKEKCIRQGYHVEKERPALVAEEQVAYKLA